MHGSPSLTERATVAGAAFSTSLLFLLLGPVSNFSPAGFLDPWFYTAYFTNFSYLVQHYGPNYFVARLPWILPGLLAFRLAPPETASVLLNTAIMTVSLVALYWAVRWHYGRTPALVVCCALGANPYFLSSLCWDYPDGAAIAYAFAGLAFAVRPHGKAAWNTVLAAAFLTLAGLTNLTAGPMLLSVPIFVFWRHRRAVREWKRDVLLLAAGAAVTVLAFCPLSQVLVGRWTYFYWQIYQATNVVSNPAVLDRMWGTGPAFLLTAPRFFAPLFLLAAGAILLRRPKVAEIAFPAMLTLGACFAIFAFEEFVMRVPTLRVPYHASYLVVPGFFLAGVVLGEMGELAPRWALVAAVLAVALPFGQFFLVQRLPVWLTLLALAAAALIGSGPWRQACLVALLFLSPGLDLSLNYMWDRPAGANLRAFRSLMTFQHSLQAAIDPRRPVQFWIDEDDQTPLNLSAESLYLYLHNDFTRELTSAPAAEVRRMLKPNATLVHLTSHADRLEARRKLLAARGIEAGNERTVRLPWGAMVLQDVTSLSGLR